MGWQARRSSHDVRFLGFQGANFQRPRRAYYAPTDDEIFFIFFIFYFLYFCFVYQSDESEL